ncbi:hypothetical protein ADUPG1_001464, partial [Aduncisulcus paluster]
KPVADITRKLLKMDVKELLSHFFPSGWIEKYPDAYARLPRPASPPDPSIIQAQADAMIDWDGCCSQLNGLDKSTLVISGLDDDILPEKLSAKIAEQVKGSWLVRYKNATHWLMYQDPVGLGRTSGEIIKGGQCCGCSLSGGGNDLAHASGHVSGSIDPFHAGSLGGINLDETIRA